MWKTTSSNPMPRSALSFAFFASSQAKYFTPHQPSTTYAQKAHIGIGRSVPTSVPKRGPNSSEAVRDGQASHDFGTSRDFGAWRQRLGLNPEIVRSESLWVHPHGVGELDAMDRPFDWSQFHTQVVERLGMPKEHVVAQPDHSVVQEHIVVAKRLHFEQRIEGEHPNLPRVVLAVFCLVSSRRIHVRVERQPHPAAS